VLDKLQGTAFKCIKSIVCATDASGAPDRGVATGCISVYIPPKSVYLTNFYVVTGCCFFSLTQDKFGIVPVCALASVSFTYLHTTIYTPRMKLLATPLEPESKLCFYTSEGLPANTSWYIMLIGGCIHLLMRLSGERGNKDTAV